MFLYVFILGKRVILVNGKILKIKIKFLKLLVIWEKNERVVKSCKIID